MASAGTPCGIPFDSPGGWVLGSFWAHHGRIFTGSDIASLTLQQPGEHPLAPEPLAPPPDCGSVDGVPFAAVPYPQFRVALIGGVTTVFEWFVPPEQVALIEEADDDPDTDAGEVRSTVGSRRYAQLVDGTWELTELGGVRVPETLTFLDYGGTPAFAEAVTVAPSIQHLFTIIDGVQSRSTAHPVLDVAARSSIEAGATSDITAVGDTLLLVGIETADPFSSPDRETPARIVVVRSAPGEGSTAPSCDLRAGGTCRFSDLTTHPDYPDFSGRDLAGVDMIASNLGGASFDGADLTDARMWIAETDPTALPSFVGADLTGAGLQRTHLGELSGATVTGASFDGARITSAAGVDFSSATVTGLRLDDISGVVFGDADLSGATLISTEALPDLAALTYDRLTVRLNPPAGTTVEVDLSDLDLTNVWLQGPLAVSDDPSRWIVVTSLTGAVIDGTRFSEVDLSRVDPGVDLSELRVRTDSTICPDGVPPDGHSFYGTCVREG